MTHSAHTPTAGKIIAERFSIGHVGLTQTQGEWLAENIDVAIRDSHAELVDALIVWRDSYELLSHDAQKAINVAFNHGNKIIAKTLGASETTKPV